MDETVMLRLIETASHVIGEHAQKLDLLDAAIGDGDHGTNLARGLAALAARKAELAGCRLPDLLATAGEVIGREAGGDGGRIYAALFHGMASAAPEDEPGLGALARMVEAGVSAVREVGGARPGEKTLLDVLQPVADVLRADLAAGRLTGVGSRLVAAAAYGLHRTSRHAAKHGQAAELGAASVNHLDPGALSGALLIGAIVSALEDKTGRLTKP